MCLDREAAHMAPKKQIENTIGAPLKVIARRIMWRFFSDFLLDLGLNYDGPIGPQNNLKQ